MAEEKKEKGMEEEVVAETKEFKTETTEENEEVLEEAELVEEEPKVDELEEAKKEIAKWKDSYMRKIAEFENIKKRLQREKEEFVKYASEKLVVKVLEAVDNLERAIESSKKNQDFDSLVTGVEMTLNQMHKLLKDEGVEPLESEGKEFDPYQHHAMMQEQNEEFEHNTVIQELQKGYKMKDKVIRPALVKVAKNK
ncbi:MAG: nucleotide exchange factor GrpE [Fusobacteriia bacterium 4572_132]|nr:MAG: nucleotide exchange factor GrpE [Fusobacteriia bacterium 4572_132]